MTKLPNALFVVAALLWAPACKSKSQHAGAADAIAKMTALSERMCACTDADCARKVDDELVKVTKDRSPTFSQPEIKQMAELSAKASECFSRATRTAADAGSGSAVAAPAGSGSATTAGSDSGPSGLPKECDDYKSVVDRIQTCEALPKQARATLLKAFADAAEGWKKHEGPDKLKDGVACKDAAAALAATGKARCAW